MDPLNVRLTTNAGDSQPLWSKWLQGVAGIVSALGVLLALLFVSINSAYVYFYEMLGVTPEDVGFDRLAILARTAGLLLPACILGALMLAVYQPDPADGMRAFFVELSAASALLALLILAHVYEIFGIWADAGVVAAAFLVGVLYLVRLAKFAVQNKYLTATCWGLALLTLLIGIHFSLIALVRPRIDQALKGQPVRLIQLIDFQAIPARILWLNPPKNPSDLLQDPYLLYLGHGPRGQVLLACRNVVTVPSDLVVIEDGFHLYPQIEVDSQQRSKLCNHLVDEPRAAWAQGETAPQRK